VLPNDLKCILIRDTTAKLSACAMAVNVGSLEDTVNGLAHLCEHMLFQGSAKYPDPMAYQNLLSKNNGSHNALTGEDVTIYHFECASEFTAVLDHFCHFFKAPIFDPERLDAELNMIESEFKKN
jgi:insulysin